MISKKYCIFSLKIIKFVLANNADPVEMPHYLGLQKIPVKNGLRNFSSS